MAAQNTKRQLWPEHCPRNFLLWGGGHSHVSFMLFGEKRGRDVFPTTEQKYAFHILKSFSVSGARPSFVSKCQFSMALLTTLSVRLWPCDLFSLTLWSKLWTTDARPLESQISGTAPTELFFFYRKLIFYIRTKSIRGVYGMVACCPDFVSGY